MYENYLSATENGVKDVEITVEGESYWTDISDSHEQQTNPKAVSISVTFAVGTDQEAWVTIDGAGEISPHFGGTGVCDKRFQQYIQQAVSIWQAITGKEAACTLTKSF